MQDKISTGTAGSAFSLMVIAPVVCMEKHMHQPVCDTGLVNDLLDLGGDIHHLGPGPGLN